MSKRRREIQQELQKDEVAETFQRINDFFRNNRTGLIGLVVLAVLGGLFAMALHNHNQTKLVDSNAKFMQLLQNYSMLEQAEPAQRAAKLTEVANAARSLADAYPGTKLGREAIYIRGNAYYAADDFPKAEADFKAYLNDAKTDEERARAEIALGYTFENNAFLLTAKTPEEASKNRMAMMNSAMTHYQSAMTHAVGSGSQTAPADPYLYYYGMLCQARIMELTGQTAKAAEAYNLIIKERPNPAAQSKDKTPENTASGDMWFEMIRKEVKNAEAPLSLEATAKLRLDRLQSSPKGPASLTTEVKATSPTTSATKTTAK